MPCVLNYQIGRNVRFDVLKRGKLVGFVAFDMEAAGVADFSTDGKGGEDPQNNFPQFMENVPKMCNLVLKDGHTWVNPEKGVTVELNQVNYNSCFQVRTRTSPPEMQIDRLHSWLSLFTPRIRPCSS